MEDTVREHLEPEAEAGELPEPELLREESNQESVAWSEEDLEPEFVVEPQPEARPWSATLHRSSLAFLVIGLVIGLAAGYLGRPLIVSDSQTPEPEVAAAAPTESAPSPATSESAENLANATAVREAAQTIMDAMVAQTRHFRGDPNAPVTIIEFGDFQ